MYEVVRRSYPTYYDAKTQEKLKILSQLVMVLDCGLNAP
jgi:hypothetical protein